MIRVNGKDFNWEEELTVERLLEKKRYTYSRIIVKINGRLIQKDEYASTLIFDEDDVQAIHLLAGG